MDGNSPSLPPAAGPPYETRSREGGQKTESQSGAQGELSWVGTVCNSRTAIRDNDSETGEANPT